MYTGWGLVDRNFGHVDLVNKALGLVNKPKWHFEMACILLRLLTCWSERAVYAGERAVGGAYADAQALRYH